MPLALLLKKDEPVALPTLLEHIRSNVKGMNCGAIVTFTGIVRPKTVEGAVVDRLE